VELQEVQVKGAFQVAEESNQYTKK
jgi:hypothetical protein